MKRSLTFCAIALVALAANSAQALVDAQLNLRYTNPADLSAGGTWELLVKSTSNGLSGVVVLLDNAGTASKSVAGVDDAVGTNPFAIFESQTVGTVTEIVTGHDQDLIASSPQDVGLGSGSTGAVADDLYTNPCCTSATWADSVSLASGSFTGDGSNLAFVATATDGGTTVDEGANQYDAAGGSATAVEAIGFNLQNIRSDSNIVPGDANRDGIVDGLDFSILASPANFGLPGGWDNGNFNNNPDGSDTIVDGLDFSILASPANFGMSATPPAITAVPEPSSLLLVAGFGLAGLGIRRRS